MSTSFTFAEAEFQAVVQEWTELRALLDEQRVQFDQLNALATTQPAPDLATTGFLARAQATLEAANNSHSAISQYVDRYLTKLHNTAAQYAATDEASAEGITMIME